MEILYHMNMGYPHVMRKSGMLKFLQPGEKKEYRVMIQMMDKEGATE